MCRPPAATTWSCRACHAARSCSRVRLVDLARGGELGLEVAAEHDVGAAAGHVGGDGHGARAAGLGDDVRLALVLLGVEHLVRHVLLLQQAGEELGGLDRGGADQRRLAALDAVRMSSMIASNLSFCVR